MDGGDLGLRHLLVDLFHTLTDVDSRLIRSIRRLLFQPGALTTAYLEGPRNPYIAPFQLFLLANVLFFAVQSVISFKIFSTPLASHLHGQDWSALARDLVDQRLALKHVTLEAYTPVFDQAVAVNARSLVGVMAIPFALLLTALFSRSGRPFAGHVMFSLHFYSFQLVLFCVFLVLLAAQARLGGASPRSAGLDTGVFVVQLAICALYLYIATGRVYRAKGLSRLVKVAALVIAVGAVVLGYRFFVFLVTLYTT
ncbi:MAG TPA: DUF3667 domain-containing protein [Steroidobacteraceae bacterium]|nr:DUF3667 domain-containing protein [Steroidobacteraceae bacterium]